MAAVALVGPPEIYQAPAVTAAAAALVGPPEIYQAPAVTVAAAAMGDAFVDLMEANFNDAATQYSPPMGLTENESPTFLSTGDPCLDFFFHVVPDTPPETLTNLLQLAWSCDPLKALKLVCNLRGVRGTGKSDKEGFYTAALWLHEHHPKTLAANVAAIAEFGYYKDLLEILFRLLEGSEARESARSDGRNWKLWVSAKERFKKLEKEYFEMRNKLPGWSEDLSEEMKESRLELKEEMKEMRKSLYEEKRQRTQLRKLLFVMQTHEQKRIQRGKRVVERFNHDPQFRSLHEQISDLFAQHLRSDMEKLKLGKLNEISLAGKWCPSLYSSFDRITLLCETIAKRVFPREEYAEYDGVEEAHYTYRVRDRLRKEVLVPLRSAMQLPEVYIGANDWGSLPYNRVASVAMKSYCKSFFKHDEERFREYLDNVKSGKAKIAAGALLPHQIIEALEDEGSEQVAELQWKRMVDDVAEKGKLNNCLAICDVSGSMEGTPMEVAVALGILVSELSEDPWKGKLFTFSESPQLQILKGEP